jgi:hypothetical protein
MISFLCCGKNLLYIVHVDSYSSASKWILSPTALRFEIEIYILYVRLIVDVTIHEDQPEVDRLHLVITWEMGLVL